MHSLTLPVLLTRQQVLVFDDYALDRDKCVGRVVLPIAALLTSSAANGCVQSGASGTPALLQWSPMVGAASEAAILVANALSGRGVLRKAAGGGGGDGHNGKDPRGGGDGGGVGPGLIEALVRADRGALGPTRGWCVANTPENNPENTAILYVVL